MVFLLLLPPPSRSSFLRLKMDYLLPPRPSQDPKVQVSPPATDLCVRIYVFILFPSSVEVSPSRCASGGKRTSPSATPPPHLQQIAYTSGGETGRGRSGYEGEEERRGAKTPEGDGVKKKEREEKKKRARAQPPRSSRPGFSAGSLPLRSGSASFTRPGWKFCAEAGSGGACAARRAASHLRAGRGRGTPAPAATGGRRGHPPPPGSGGGGAAARGKATPF